MIDFVQRHFALLLYPAFSCLLSLFLTWVCIRLMPALDLIDYPRGRHIHKRAIPTGGGLAIFLSFNLTIFCYFVSSWTKGQNPFALLFFWQIFLPGTLLLIIGLCDDRFALSAKSKLVGQILVSIICWQLGAKVDSFFGYLLSDWLSCVVTVIWILCFINSFNLIDGLDGLAAGLGVIASVCMATWFVFCYNLNGALVILCLGGACLGFLRYNFYPAKIFMGDTGSMFIGFVFALQGIDSFNKAATFSAVLIPLLAAGVPIIDVFLAVWRRLSKKITNRFARNNGLPHEKSDLMQGDKEHLHHRILDLNKNQSRTAFYLYLLGCLFAFMAVILMLLKDRAPAIAFVIILIAAVTAIRRLAVVEMWNSAKMFITGFSRPQGGLVIAMLHPFLDLFFISGSYLITEFLFRKSFNVFNMVCAVTPIILIFHLFRIYRIYWLRASVRDYRYIAEALFIGNLMATLISYQFALPNGSENFPAEYIFFYLLSTAFIVSERFFIRYVESCMVKNLYLRRFAGENIPRAVIYGGGLNCRLFLSYLSSNIERRPVKILGIVDDEPALRDLRVYGHPVIGPLSELDDFLETADCDRIIIASSAISADRRKKVSDIAAKYRLELMEIKLSEEVIYNGETGVTAS